MARFSVQVNSDYKKYLRQLRDLHDRRLPAAQAATLNAAVKAVDHHSHKLIRQKFILRNQYTERGLKVAEARVSGRTGRVGYAEVGSISPYMPLQETGGTVRARRRRIAIPTRAARGGSKQGIIRPRFRLNRMGGLNQPGSKFFTLYPAAGPYRRHGKMVSPRLRKAGIFYRQSKRKILFVRDIESARIRVRPTRWHRESVEKFGKRSLLNQVFIREAKKQLGLIA
jgi:hypothetical protein